MPAGTYLPEAGARAVERLERHLGATGRLLDGYRALLAAFDGALALGGGGLADRDRESLGAALEAWRRGGYARRTVVRLLTAPLKLAHYHDPQIYADVGCRFGVLRVAAPERPRHLIERVHDAASLEGNEALECDVVVVGTGAGGAACAAELAERGHAVVLVEEGAYHGREAFSGHAMDAQRRLYRDGGATYAVGNAIIPIPVGQAVGGSTVVNSGTCYRAPARVLEAWARQGLSGLAPDALAPYYTRVEEVLGVAEADARHLGGVARVVSRGCEALGYRHRPLRRNAPGCDGQGVCCFGCPTDAKRSTNVSYVPRALKAGAELFTGARVERVLVEGGRAIGVQARAGSCALTVRARAVVIACGALLTPVLLEASGLGGRSGQLGRNLSIHPATASLALFSEAIDGDRAIPQGYAVEEFHDEGLLFEGAFAPLDVAAASFLLLGRPLVEMVERFRHLACFGFMLEDTSRGRVRRGPGGRPLVTYWLGAHDVARLKRGVEILARIYFAAGAQTVLPNVHGFEALEGPEDLERLRRARLTARDFDLTAYHPLGTARMGIDAASSVVGPGHQVHGTPGLYVADGSVLPGSPAVNPQVTIMALGLRAADLIDRALA